MHPYLANSPSIPTRSLRFFIPNYSPMKLDGVLDDLCTRFILHLSPEDRNDRARLFFQLEEAHWFYEDYYRGKHRLPYLSLKDFSSRLVVHCQLGYTEKRFEEEFRDFLKYKKSVPVFGALIFNPGLTKILLVKGFGPRQSYTFPKGKICMGEDQEECASREVYEEIGYDIRGKMLRSLTLDMSTKSRESRLFVVVNVSEATCFETQTRNEIKDISWVSIERIESGRESDLGYVKAYVREICAIERALKEGKFTFEKKRLGKAFRVDERIV
jgi:mRNA-decapping enzyme subunit 2